MIDDALGNFLMLFVTIDPIGTLSLFVPLTSGLDARQRARVALRAVVCAGVVLMGFLVAGQLVLSGMGVQLVSFQLAGGVVLFLFGLQMIFGTGVADPRASVDADHDVAVFPLAVPSIASPGSIMAVVLLTDNHAHSIPEQTMTAGVLVLVLLITFVALRLAGPIHRVLGSTGASVMIRVMGLLLAALAAEQVVEGVVEVTQAVRG